jgi:hypothetical protein
MNNCTFGGNQKSANMDPVLRMHYMRGDITGKRGALTDDANKGALTFMSRRVMLTPLAASSVADGRECFRSWLTNLMTSYRAIDGFDCIGFPRIAMKSGVYPRALKNIFTLVSAMPESENRAAFEKTFSIASTNQRIGTYFLLYSVTRAGVYSLSISDHIGIHIKDSPFNIVISPGSLNARESIVNFINKAPYLGIPPGIEVGVGSRYSVSILLRDSFHNFLWGSANPPSIFLNDGYNCGSVEQCFPVIEIESQRTSVSFDFFDLVDYTDATYLFSFILPKSGRFPINIKVGNEHLAESPYFMFVYAGDVSLSSTAVSGLGINSCGAGLSCTFSVSTGALSIPRKPIALE